MSPLHPADGRRNVRVWGSEPFPAFPGASAADDTQGLQVKAVAEAGGQGEKIPGVHFQAAKFHDIQFDHIARQVLFSGLVHEPLPGVAGLVEADAAELVEKAEERPDEERIALGPVVDDGCQSGHILRGRQQRSGHELLHIVGGDVADLKHIDRDRLAAQAVYGGGQRVAGVHFVVAIGNDCQQIAQGAPHLQLPEQFAGSGVSPLPVVYEQDQGVFGLTDDLEEVTENIGKAVPGFLRADVAEWRLASQQRFEFRNQVDQNLPQAPHGLENVGLETRALRRIPGLQFLAEFFQCLAKREIRDILPVLIEFAAYEKTVPLPDRLAQLLYQCRLAHPGRAGNQQHVAVAAADALK